MTPLLQANGLSKTYSARFPKRDSFDALSDMTFDVRPGEIFAFLGPNGAGKTTTINLLLGFLNPTRGECRLFGLDPRERRAREQVGFLPENYAFYPAFTAPTLLNYFGRLQGIPAPERLKRIDELIERVDLTEARRRPVGKYSRGMRQRLGIAQALLNRPKLLILDEPTSGFDPIGRYMVRDLLSELKQSGVSIFLCSHILSEVEAICDRVVIIDRGRTVREGTLASVLGTGRGFEIVFRDASGDVSRDLAARGTAIEELENNRRIAVNDEAEAQRLLDQIRAGGGVIVRYQAIGRSLEETFIQDIAGRHTRAQEKVS